MLPGDVGQAFGKDAALDLALSQNERLTLSRTVMACSPGQVGERPLVAAMDALGPFGTKRAA